ncbi:MAG: hypothetical protein RMJ87_08275 [Cytophagales bacterium]|nr:hypothetical protein [Bernardetiaceae bacterium]MDW8205007.1 hypothetical protein [Cytophagales bacterium]
MNSLARRLYRKWLMMAPLGLVLIGLGLSLFGEATMRKYAQADFWDWFTYGTLSLAVFNAGLSVFGEAVVCRSRYLAMKDREKN